MLGRSVRRCLANERSQQKQCTLPQEDLSTATLPQILSARKTHHNCMVLMTIHCIYVCRSPCELRMIYMYVKLHSLKGPFFADTYKRSFPLKFFFTGPVYFSLMHGSYCTYSTVQLCLFRGFNFCSKLSMN